MRQTGLSTRPGGVAPGGPEHRTALTMLTGLALVLVLALAGPAGAGESRLEQRHQESPTSTTVPTTAAPTTTTIAEDEGEEEAAPTGADEPDEDPSYWVLLGVGVIVAGFLLKIDAIAVVIIAAAVTALVYGASFGDFLEVIGQSFVDNRNVSFFILTLPMIALSERFGLKEQAVNVIRGMKQVTAPRFTFLYTVIRQLCGIFGIRISGMVQFVRPIVQPMSSAAIGEAGQATDRNEELIKAESAKAENVGNFFGQNGFVAASGVLLIVGTLEGLGYEVQPDEVVVASIPVIIVATFFAYINSHLLARQLKAGAGPEATPTTGGESTDV